MHEHAMHAIGSRNRCVHDNVNKPWHDILSKHMREMDNCLTEWPNCGLQLLRLG